MIRSILFLPHGMQVIPGTEPNQQEEFSWLHSKMLSLMDQVNYQSDTSIVLLTPHGYNLEDDLVLYHHKQYLSEIYSLSGESVVYGDAIASFHIDGNLELNNTILSKSNQVKLPIQLLTHGSVDYPLNLNWGSTVPLYYLRSLYDNLSVSILCYPRTRHHDLERITQLNLKLLNVLDSLDQDLMLVISGDLSHVHKEDGPYGIHHTAKPFDQQVQDWAEDPLVNGMDSLLEMQPTALACGIAGLHLIDVLRKTRSYSLQASFYSVPTYFGMSGFYWIID